MKTHVMYEGVSYEVAELSDDALRDLKVAFNADIASIKMQLESAKTDRVVNGTYADPSWFRSASNARMIKAMDVQAIDRELAKRKQEKKERAQTVEELSQRRIEVQFLKVAKEYLPSDDFRRLLEIAQDRLKSTEKP